jgi:hypothetical protein
MTPEQLDELDRLENAATPGPWEESAGIGDHFHIRAICHENGLEGRWLLVGTTCPRERKDSIGMSFWPVTIDAEVDQANADLIAASRNALPALIAEVRRLRGILGNIVNVPEHVAELAQAFVSVTADTLNSGEPRQTTATSDGKVIHIWATPDSQTPWTRNADLVLEIERLRAENAELKEQVAELDDRIAWFERETGMQ